MTGGKESESQLVRDLGEGPFMCAPLYCRRCGKRIGCEEHGKGYCRIAKKYALKHAIKTFEVEGRKKR